MAYNVSEERLLELMISDPAYCLFYHREKVKILLPKMAEAYLMIGKIKKELEENLLKEKKICTCGTDPLGNHDPSCPMSIQDVLVRPDKPDYRLPGDDH